MRIFRTIISALPSLRAPAARVRLLGHGVFWAWNLLFLAVVLLGLLPLHLLDVLRAAVDGDAPRSLLLGALVLVLVPLLSTAVGAAFLRRQPAQLLRAFYGVEAPLFAAALLRVFLLRELTAAQEHLLLWAALAVVAFGYGLAFPPAPDGSRRGAAALVLRHGGASLGLVGALYFSALLLLYAVPLGWLLMKGLFSFGWLHGLLSGLRHSHGATLLLLPLGALLFAFSATLLCLAPLAVPWLYGQAFAHSARAARPRLGLPLVIALPALVALGNAALFVRLGRQPQLAALRTLSAPPHSDEERRARLAQAEELRAGLLNAYLAPQRYLGAAGTADHIADLYAEAFALPRPLGLRLQRVHDQLASPVVYQGDKGLHGDGAEAAVRYAELFDQPIQRGERAAIRAALSATYERTRREAGLLSIDDCRVRLVEQTLRVEAAGDAAEVELQEVYENQTTEQQEIFYYFSLPEGAVPTGLWLGEEGGPRQAFVVAPRGAAQRVYAGEVRRRRDPALLEQIGPRQFRLRAFPIPPRPRAEAAGHGEADLLGRRPAPRLHLWLRVAVLAQGGALPLPVLGERRGVCWDGGTRRIADPGAPWPREDWLPAALPLRAPAPAPRRLRFTLGAERLTVRAEPLPPSPPLPGGRSLALVIDRSYSMGSRARALSAALSELRAGACARGACDLYLSATPSRGEAPSLRAGAGALEGFDPAQIVFYGGGRAADLLEQQRALGAGRRYDAILVLTDDGSLDLADDRGADLDPGAPVYLIHLGGRLAPGYDDRTLRAVRRRGGGAFLSVGEALGELAAATAASPAAAPAGRGGAYRFTVEREAPRGADVGAGAAPAADPCAQAGPFARIAAARLLAVAERGLPDGEPLRELDALHGLARACAVVTPYSSMLVLVDDAQREALRRAEAERDRFSRRVESGEEPVPGAADVLVTGTPEPEEWLLLGIAALLLLWAAQARRAPRWAS